MRVFYIFILITGFYFQSFSQHCKFDYYYLLAVNVHTRNSADKIPHLSMYLANEEGKALTAPVTYQEKKQWKHSNDTLFFWENESISKREANTQLLRRHYFHIGDYYVVAFRLDMAKLKDPREMPVFTLKIPASEYELTGEPILEQKFHLPLNKALRMCNSGIGENFRLAKPLENLDGQPFVPIDIVLDEVEPPGVAEDLQSGYPKYAIRFDYEKSTNAVAYNREEFTIRAADIYDVSNGRVHQRIEIPSQVIGFSETFNHLSATGDFYQRNLEKAKDFSVVMERWRDTVFNVERNKTNFYVFNEASEKYVLDSLLSKETDVYEYPPMKTMRKLEYVLTEKSKIINTWQLENKQWKLIDRREELLPAFIRKIKYAPEACIIFNEKFHRLPMIAVIGNNAYKWVKDSFLLYNACEYPIQITSVKSSNRDFFKINQTLPPRQYSTLYFEGKIDNSSFDYLPKNFECYLTLEDNTTLPFSIQVPVISNNCRVYYRADSSIDYAIAQQAQARFTKAMLTHPDGSIRAIGMVQDQDTTLKQGKWQYYETGDWKIREEFYSKSICLSALNGTSYMDRPSFKIKLLEHGKWRTPVTQMHNEENCCYLTALTDSIVAYNDSLSYGFKLPYDKIQDNVQMQFYLLKPGERTLKLGYYWTPFRTYKDQYAIVPDYTYFHDRNKTTYQIIDSILQALKRQFPLLNLLVISKNMLGFSVEGMAKYEKERLLSQLQSDKAIGKICQLVSFTDKPMVTYADNRVYVELNGYETEPIRKAASELGFKGLQPDMGSNRYWLTYEAKMLDETFFKAYDQLSRLPMVLGIWFNAYFEPQLDNKMPMGLD